MDVEFRHGRRRRRDARRGSQAQPAQMLGDHALAPARLLPGLDGLAHTLPFPVSSALVVLALWLFAGLAGAWALTRRIRP